MERSNGFRHSTLSGLKCWKSVVDVLTGGRDKIWCARGNSVVLLIEVPVDHIVMWQVLMPFVLYYTIITFHSDSRRYISSLFVFSLQLSQSAEEGPFVLKTVFVIQGESRNWSTCMQIHIW